MSERGETELERKVVAVEERVTALDRLMEEKIGSFKLLVAQADIKIDERFKSHNEFREQIRQERSDYVTRAELRWLIGIVFALFLAVIRLFLERTP